MNGRRKRRIRRHTDPVHLSDHFIVRRLLRYALPSVIMMVFTSVYAMVDGFFVSNLVGQTPFAAVNLIQPVPEILGAVGYVFSTGGSALISLQLGEGKPKEANETFSLLVYAGIVIGICITVIGIPLVRPLCRILGATPEMLPYAVRYGQILVSGILFLMLEYMFQEYMVVSERPGLGLAVMLLAGSANIGLDALFMAVFHLGVAGAGWATVISQAIGGIVPLIYFFRAKDSVLHLGRTHFRPVVLLKTLTNGASEFMTTMSTSVVAVLYNLQLIRMIGEDGVSAYGVLTYIAYIFTSVSIGYAEGTAPIVSFHYGEGDARELKSLVQKGLIIVGIGGVVMTVLEELLAFPLSRMFIGYDPELLRLTVHAFRIYSFSFLLSGFNVWIPSLFTALNDGFDSALLTFLQSLVFQVGCILLLPRIFGADGIWGAIIAAESMPLVLAVVLLVRRRKKFRY